MAPSPLAFPLSDYFLPLKQFIHRSHLIVLLVLFNEDEDALEFCFFCFRASLLLPFCSVACFLIYTRGSLSSSTSSLVSPGLTMSNPFNQVNQLRPGTTMRPGSQMRPGTNGGMAAGIGGSLQQPISVTAQAAVSREGVRAASRAGPGVSAGPGRQVGDRSYYIGLLRPKITELSAEIDRLNEQERLIGQNSSVLTQLQQKAKTLSDEIAKLKTTLSEVNLAVESSNTRDVASMQKENLQLTQDNTRRRKEVDKLFLSVKDAEAKTKASVQAMEEEMAALDKRILAGNEDYATYKAVRDEALQVSDQVLERQHELRTLTAKQELLMAKLAKDNDKRRAAETLREILRKRREREELTKQCALSVEEEKQMLIKQVKATRSDIEVLERQVNDNRDTLQESRVRLSALDEEVKSYSGDNVKTFQALKEKDEEMQKFIDEYPDRERESSDKVEAAQKEIKSLLERISQALDAERQLPAEGSPGALQALTTEADARQNQIANDQRTYERLGKELLERKAELDKVASLDKKIKEELESHHARMAEQKVEMERFADLDSLRSEVDKLRRSLEEKLVYLKRVREGGTKRLNTLSADYEATNKQLQADEVFSSLATQEQKVRMLWQSTFSLEDFVRLKEKETQYNSTKAECLRLVDEINLLLKDPARMAGMPGAPILNLS